MVKLLRWRLKDVIAEATLFALFGGVSADLLSAPNVEFTNPRHFMRASNVSAAEGGKHPFRPSPIVDPFSDINCDEKNMQCSAQDPCKDFPMRICREYTPCNRRLCLHKNLWPMLGSDLALFVVMFLIALCAGAAGIGGGGLNVPIVMMIGSMSIKEAVPLSHAAVMGNAFAQLFVNVPQRHPSAPQRPLIHYELGMLVLPAVLGGNSLGVVIGRVFPPTLLIILSLAMLALAASKTLMKGIHVFREFRDRVRKPVTRPSSNNVGQISFSPVIGPPGTDATSSPRIQPTISKDLGLPAVGTGRGVESVRTWSGTNVLPRHAANALWAGNEEPAAAQSNASETEVPVRIPWRVISFMVIFNIIFCLDYLLMSTDVSHVKKCSPLYFVALLGLYPFVAATLWLGIRSLKQLSAYHRDRQDPPVAGDPEITIRLVILFPAAAIIIGLIAGLVGLGGGEFMVPLLLEFGLLPRVASATSGFLILFSTSSNIVHYLIAGTMEPFMGYGIGVFVIAFLGALVGLGIRDTKYMKEHNYLLVFLLAVLLTLSGGLLAYRGFFQSSIDWSFKDFCGA